MLGIFILFYFLITFLFTFYVKSLIEISYDITSRAYSHIAIYNLFLLYFVCLFSQLLLHAPTTEEIRNEEAAKKKEEEDRRCGWAWILGQVSIYSNQRKGNVLSYIIVQCISQSPSMHVSVDPERLSKLIYLLILG